MATRVGDGDHAALKRARPHTARRRRDSGLGMRDAASDGRGRGKQARGGDGRCGKHNGDQGDHGSAQNR